MSPHRHDKYLILNGKQTPVYEGETILQVALRSKVNIPTLCHDPRLSVSGHCKVCLVEADGIIKASCITAAKSGMDIQTHSEKAVNARKRRVEAILKKHKGDCQTCAQHEFCGLLDLTEQVGLPRPSYRSDEPVEHEIIENKLQIDLGKCIRCGKCVRVCAEIRKVGALTHPALSPGVEKITFSKECEKCGQCAVICPTGAIVEVYRGRPDKRVKSVCTYCGTGCGIFLEVKDGKVVGVTSHELDPVGMGNLCVKGRFGFSFIHHPDRLKTPLIRKDRSTRLSGLNGLKDLSDLFEEASWQDALEYTASRITEIKKRFGPQAIGGLGSARATNEDNYMFQRMMRAAVGTNNIDNCARL